MEVTPEIEATAVRLGGLISHIFVYDGGRQLRAIDEQGLNLAQLKVLLALVGDMRAGSDCVGAELSERLGVSGATISRTVDSLVEKGLLTRAEDPQDRRRRVLAVTELGFNFVDRVAAARLAGIEEFVADLPERHRISLDRVLDEILGSIDTSWAEDLLEKGRK